MTKDYNGLEFKTKDGNILLINATAVFGTEDIGIGPYEYWGAKCHDSQVVAVCEDIEGVEAIDDNGKDIYDTLSKDEKDSINEMVEEYANDHAPDVSDVEADYDEDRPDYYESDYYEDNRD